MESLISLYEKGCSERKLAEIFGINRYSVRKKLLENKLIMLRDEIINLFNDHYSVIDISKKLNITYWSVVNIIKDLKIIINDKEDILKMFSEGLSLNQVAILKNLPLENKSVKEQLLFLNKVKIDNGCWIWQAAKDRKGYGKFQNKYAHRYILKVENGIIPNNLVVCHKCDNPSCVNPKHLFLGTVKENLMDAENKGIIKRNGEDNPSAKIKNDDILKIISLYESGKDTEEIAKQFSVTKNYITAILKGKSRNKTPIIKNKRKSSRSVFKKSIMNYLDFINADIGNSYELIKFYETNDFDKTLSEVIKKYNLKYSTIIKARLRFLSKIKISNDCWEIKNTKGKNIYSHFWFGLSYRLFHHVSYEIFNKSLIPEGMLVCHKCDHKNCVNPEHLYLGTPKENIQDAVKRGLIKTGINSPNTKIKSIEEKQKIINLYKNGKTQNEIATIYEVSSPIIRKVLNEFNVSKKPYSNSKLTENDVIAILEEYGCGISINILAQKYKVRKGTIHDLIEGRSWKHINKERKQMTEMKVFYATVVWFNNKKGYGYIKPDEDLSHLNKGKEDFFVHYSNIVSDPGTFKTLTAGQKVSFVIGANKNGPQAEKIVVLAEPEFEG